MAKLTFTINDFSGGTNGYVDPLDIADNELAQCQGFKAESGVVSVLGDMKGLYTIGTGDTAASGNIDVESGYGLFAFSHDYDMAGGQTDRGTNLALSNTDYFFMMSRLAADSHNKIDVYDSADHTWRTDMIDLGASLSDNRFPSIKPCFFVADGAVRISPGRFDQASSGGTLKGDADGSFASDANPGGLEEVETIANFHLDVEEGDTIIVGKGSAYVPGQEMVALITATTTLHVARNMTGSFSGAVNAATSGHDVVYVIPDTRWRGVVKRKSFSKVTASGTFTEWYSSYAHPRPPVTYHADLDAGSMVTDYTAPFCVEATDGAITVDGSIAPCLSVGYKVDEDLADASWDGASISLFVTALYDDVKQESQPNEVATAVTIAAGKELGVYIAVNYIQSSVYLINRRVSGARVYYEDLTNDPGVLYQLVEVDFDKGCKKAESEKFSEWNAEAADKAVGCPFNAGTTGATAAQRTTVLGDAFIFGAPPKAFTYNFNTGYPPDINTHARYKTAVVANRRLFVGNVYQSGKANGDRMISSPINAFDILPEYGDYVIDATVGDGDEIVKLEAYADRILQFKKRTLYIINVGGGLGEEFIESQHRNMGVENPSQTCMTEYGVAWVNTHGVFLYDGQEISDLTRDKLQMTNATDRPRALNITESNIPLIGYHPDNKWLVVHSQSAVTDGNDVEAWIHDFKNGSWTYSQELTITDEKKSNMIWTGDNNLVFAAVDPTATPNFYKYQDSTDCDSGTFGVATKLLLLTKEFHLNAPGVKKKLRSVYITYSATANSYIEADLIYKHSTGSTTDDLEEAGGGSDYYTEELGFKDTSGAVRTVELVPTTYSTNAYTFQLKLHNPDVAYPEGADFKLYNIAFVYRPLGTR